ncbi:MAG: DUF2298 domain-containing protein [Chloroflexi bacterium]|nr:DUF2298 domain-containing protein [Chloroflexota bacterium]
MQSSAAVSTATWAGLFARIQNTRWIRLIALSLVVMMAFSLRVYNLNWDQGNHLHPDERGIVLIASEIHWPDPNNPAPSPGGAGYSPLDPHFFAYGSLPFYLLAASGNIARHVGVVLRSTPLAHTGFDSVLRQGDNIYGMTLVGRFLSTIFDTGSVLLCFALGRALYGRWTGILAAALYAVTMLAVQQAHYFVVDPILVFWILLTLLLCVWAVQRQRRSLLLAAAVAAGAALATKVSAAPLGLPLMIATVVVTASEQQGSGEIFSLVRRLRGIAFALVIEGLITLLIFLLCEPFSVLDWRTFVTDILTQGAMASGALDLPYTRQYAPTLPYLYWAQGLLTWEMTPLLASVGFTGLGRQLWRSLRFVSHPEQILTAWWLPYALITGSFYAKFPRYMLPLAPCMCIAGAGLLGSLASNRRRWLQVVATAATTLTLASAFLYCLAYEHIYASTNTRIKASEWIYNNIPPYTAGHPTTLTHEEWDDVIPLDLSDVNPFWDPNRYVIINLPLYAPDTASKRRLLIHDVQRADYIVEGSEIVRGSILRNPQRYPMTVAYYHALADGRLGFQKVASFRSVPTLFGWRFDDRASDLNWQFYDHPPVTIYKKVRQDSAATLRSLLPLPLARSGTVSNSTPLAGVSFGPLRPSQLAGPTPPPLFANPTPTPLASQVPSLSTAVPTYDAMFPPHGLAMQYAPVVWFVLIEVLGGIALPWTVRLLRSTPELAWSVAKPVGVLLFGWGTWIVASLTPFGNRLATMVGVFAVLIAAGIILGLRSWRLPSLRGQWRLWLLGEAVFCTIFLLFLVIRSLNPDLWQLYRGGEKPMELAYINAIIRSPTLPPYDPWLSGTVINYYYFGFYVFAVLFRFSHIAPTTGLNLAIPLLAGTAAQVVFATGYVLCALLLKRPWIASPTWAGPSVGRITASLEGLLPSMLSRGLDRRQHPPEHADLCARIDGKAATAGIVSVVAFVLLGNLTSVPWLAQQTAHLGEVSAARLPPLIQPLGSFFYGLGMVVKTAGQALPVFDYFDLTRVIPYTINEFPFFTFLYADVHPHAIDLPFEATALAIATSLVVGARSLRNIPMGLTEFLLGGLIFGALFPINTWDYPTYLLVLFGACAVRWLDPRAPVRAVLNAGVATLVIALVGRLLFLPFYAHFASSDLGLALVTEHSPLLPWLEVFGLPVLITGSFLVRFQGRIASRRILIAVAAGLLAGLLTRSAVLGLLTALLVLLAASGWIRRWWPGEIAVLALVAIALAVLVGIEVVYIPDPLRDTDYRRMNTVFKFGEQVWLILSTTSGALLLWLFSNQVWPLRPSARTAYRLRSQQLEAIASDYEGTSPPDHQTPGAANCTIRQSKPLLPRWWRVVFAALVLDALCYPLLATPVRIADRWPHNSPTPSFDGFAFARQNYPGDYFAIRWLQHNIRGDPVILEANHGDYSWAGRVSWFTGLPTLLGWTYHTSQFHPSWLVSERQALVAELYTTPSIRTTVALLHRYDVSLVYVGSLERQLYGRYDHGAAVAKWREMAGSSLNLIYNRHGVQIYGVRGTDGP